MRCITLFFELVFLQKFFYEDPLKIGHLQLVLYNINFQGHSLTFWKSKGVFLSNENRNSGEYRLVGDGNM